MDVSPPPRQSLKRSASTASLPTPPRTYRRRARGRSRGSCDSDSDADSDNQSLRDSDNDAPRKKRRVSTKEEEEEESRFWLGGPAQGSSSRPALGEKASSSKLQGPLLYRRRALQPEQSLASPPPSHRKPGAVEEVPGSPSPAATISLPVTPKGKATKPRSASDSDLRLPRDSPNNPFLSSPLDESDLLENTSPLPAKAKDDYEKPTVSYVFRGVRRVYHNPFFDHEKGRPLSPPPNSKLPVEDPAFSPDPTCKPRLLFPEAHAKRMTRQRAKALAQEKTKATAGGPSNSSDHEGGGLEERLVRIPKPNFQAVAKPVIKTRASVRKAAAATKKDDDVFS